MPTIRFTRPYVVQNHQGRKFAIGELLECNQATAQHFLTRQAAVLVPGKPDPPKPSEAKPEEPPAPAPARRRQPAPKGD